MEKEKQKGKRQKWNKQREGKAHHKGRTEKKKDKKETRKLIKCRNNGGGGTNKQKKRKNKGRSDE